MSQKLFRNFEYNCVFGKEQDSDDEQIDNGITLKSKSIMQKTLYFLKKIKLIIMHEFVTKFYNFTMKRFLRSNWG